MPVTHFSFSITAVYTLVKQIMKIANCQLPASLLVGRIW